MRTALGTATDPDEITRASLLSLVSKDKREHARAADASARHIEPGGDDAEGEPRRARGLVASTWVDALGRDEPAAADRSHSASDSACHRPSG